MFCMKCGTELPEGAAFCWKCGTPAGVAPVQTKQQNPSPAKPAPAQTPARTVFSGKSQRMLYLPGTGLFFIALDYESLCFLPDGEKNCKKLTRMAEHTRYFGLGFYRDAVYYWRLCDDWDSKNFGTELWRLDPETLERTQVFKRLEKTPNLIFDSNRTILHAGSYYFIDGYKRLLYRLSVDDGSVTALPLPDLRKGTVPDDWKKPGGYIDMDSKQENYGEDYKGFDLVGGFGFVSLNGGAPCTLRFDLRDPSRFQCLPLDTCTALGDYCSLLVEDDGVLYGGMLGLRENNPGCLSRMELKNDRVAHVQRIADSAKLKGVLGRFDMKNWWKQGPWIFAGLMAFQTQQQKIFSVPERFLKPNGYGRSVFAVSDYAEDGRGGAFLLEEGRCVWHLPEMWFAAQDRDELERRALVAEIK